MSRLLFPNRMNIHGLIENLGTVAQDAMGIESKKRYTPDRCARTPPAPPVCATLSTMDC
jgi:hypothetical protein